MPNILVQVTFPLGVLILKSVLRYHLSHVNSADHRNSIMLSFGEFKTTKAKESIDIQEYN